MDNTAEATESNDVASETNDNQVETQVETTPQENAARVSNPEREWVDPAIDPPEKVKERLDFLYGKSKKQDRELNDWRQVARDQAAVIDELRQATGQVVNHLTQKNYADVETQLEQQISDSFQSGDTKAFLAAQNKLIDLKAAQKVQQFAPRPQVQQQNRPQYNSTSQIAAQSDLPYEDKNAVDAWQSERDERGGALRPWAINSGTESDPDPDYIKAILVAKGIFTNPDLNHLTMTQKLAEVDKRMGVKKTSGGQNVMGGGLTSKPRGGRITLSPQVEKMAIRTKFGGPKAKSDAEHIEAYRKQIDKVRSTKRGQ